MSEEYVSRNEFNSLKAEVQEIKIEMNENKDILQAISRKCDVITEKIANGEKIDELKLKPIEDRVAKLENNQNWLWKTTICSILGLAIKIIFDVTK